MSANPFAGIERGAPGTIGWRILFFNELGSTQDKAAELARDGAEHGTVVIAGAQTAGRGRLGRSWFSPQGRNLYTTIILRPTIPMAQVAQISLVAGVALAEAIESIALGIVQLKWPNDLWLNGKKAGGIIAQAVPEGESRRMHVLLGIGVNVNLTREELPPEIAETATSLRAETGREHKLESVAEALFPRLNTRYTEFVSTGLKPIAAAWERYSALTGQLVRVTESGQTRAGTARGIDADGALLLDTDEGMVRIMVGDVTVEGAYR